MTDPAPRDSKHVRYLLLVALVAAIGGLLFGFDTAVINGANVFLREHFNIVSDALYGWACSCALVGCIIGAASAGFLGDFLGRRNSLLVCAVLFTVSAVGSAVARGVAEFAIYRIVGGVGVGAASMLSPIYIAEISPARLRGRLVSFNQLAIVVGIMMAFFVNYFIRSYGHERLVGEQAWNVAVGWRWMFGSETFVAVAFFGLLLFVPASPRFLMARGKEREARAVLSKVGAPADVDAQIVEISAALREEQGTFRDLLRPGMKKALLIGVVLAVFQQWTGINAILYYSTNIFEQVGFSGNAAFASSVAIGLTNVAFTFVGIALVDRLGRKPLLIAGAAVKAAALTAVAVGFATSAQGWWVLLAVLVYVGAFSASLGPVVWVVMSEIFPTKIRGRAMSIATLALWIACYLLSQTFPMLAKAITPGGIFGCYAVMCVLCVAFVAKTLPETKGKSLEEIEREFFGPKDQPPLIPHS
ncbi:MAG: sugar porter family MFS transporter [Pirellulales bacterium]|nr:sugar porter family MFS transporter [Pirellulales bacterium]